MPWLRYFGSSTWQTLLSVKMKSYALFTDLLEKCRVCTDCKFYTLITFRCLMRAQCRGETAHVFPPGEIRSAACMSTASPRGKYPAFHQRSYIEQYVAIIGYGPTDLFMLQCNGLYISMAKDFNKCVS